ncbi:MAG: hypothetical protein JNL90_06960 [Planctomycetes bacterium]|nr:hypothetical protein [Planctomycetota bacterium]
MGLRSNPRRFARRIAALVLLASSGAVAGCAGSANDFEPATPDAGPIRSRVALFRVDARALRAPGAAAEDDDAVTNAILAPCLDDRLSQRLHAALEARCGRGTTQLLARPFADDLDFAWDQEPPPQLAVVARVKRRDAQAQNKLGGAIAGTVGWLLVGIPSLFIDDYEHASPVELELALFEGIARSDRPLGSLAVGEKPVSTDFIDRNDGVLPYMMTLLIPPHFVSALDQDDPEAIADEVLEALVDAGAQEIATRIRAWERPEQGGAAGDEEGP